MAETRKYAVATKSGQLVDEHLGHASYFEIYETDGTYSKKIATREVLPFCDGPEGCMEYEKKLERIAYVLRDCDGIITLMAGAPPARDLYRRGLPVYRICEKIEDAISLIWSGEIAPHCAA